MCCYFKSLKYKVKETSIKLKETNYKRHISGTGMEGFKRAEGNFWL